MNRLKPDWRIGKIDSVKVGRDDKVREVNVAYKVMGLGLDEWTHNVVTRPVRKIIKLFEIKDTTFAEDMLAVQKAAKEILLKKGSLDPGTIASMAKWPGVKMPKSPQDSPPVQEADGSQVPVGDSDQFHHPLLHCQGVDDWYQLQQDSQQCDGDAGGDQGAGLEGSCGYEGDEILFLM